VFHTGWNKESQDNVFLRMGKTNLSLVPGIILSPEPVLKNHEALAHAG